MLPLGLKGEELKISCEVKETIVLCTGRVGAASGLRYRRLTLLMQKAFPGRVVAWFADGVEPGFDVAASVKRSSEDELRDRERFLRLSGRVLALASRCWDLLGGFKWVRAMRDKRRVAAMERAEERLFAEELEQLRRGVLSSLSPIDVCELGGWEHPEVAAAVKEFDPYIIAAFGCAPLNPPITGCARGLVLKQSSGGVSGLNGFAAIECALYNHSLDLVCASVDLPAPGGGGVKKILRRSCPAINNDDDAASVFCRAEALGTELMIEVVDDVLEDRPIKVFIQDEDDTETKHVECGEAMDVFILKDEGSGWLKDAVVAAASF